MSENGNAPAAPDALIVSGGGSTAVAVDELFVDAARLGAAVTVIADWIDRAHVVGRGLHTLDVDEPAILGAAGSPTMNLAFARQCLEQAERRASSLRSSLLESAERYGATERLVDGLWQLAALIGAPWLGFHAPAILAGGLLVASAQAAASAMGRAFGWGPTPLASWLEEHRTLLSDPAFVRLVRVAADHADETFAGALHLPFPVGPAVRAPEGASIMLGVAGLLGIAGSHVLVDGPVNVKRVAPATSSVAADAASGRPPAGHPAEASVRLGDIVEPPSGVGDLADRVPTGEGGAQIRIEQYGAGDEKRWIVYVGGTVDVGLVAGRQPADMTSNLHGIADDTALDALRIAGAESGAGERAVREAMSRAGVGPDDPVLAVGHSGGGVIAAKLAVDPELNAVGAVNLGGPVASAPTREGVGLLSIEHEEDLVPATGGAGHPSPDRVTVSRSVLDADREYDAVLPAHELVRYRQTAALVDASEEERLASFRSLVTDVTGGVSGLRSDWMATRDLSPATGAR
ncbi:hypothetical protein [Agromyces sp. Soil535]|uniref:hypothetical protein n=1 Tax=Agromyces sp. Soil535 TaxID=1736390 RepID=UPI0006F96484|nr:hypothetical protein [Agromyces sp. Soil535]KRE31033.1 hypothetical protein ASG80_00610 [Agromyces sp. Soil535]